MTLIPLFALTLAPPPFVRPSDLPPFQDWMLTIAARTALYQDGDLSPFNLEVVVERGVARLYGPVPSVYYRDRAARVVQQLAGVVAVNNRLRISYVPPEPPGGPKQFPVEPPPAPLLPGRQ